MKSYTLFLACMIVIVAVATAQFDKEFDETELDDIEGEETELDVVDSTEVEEAKKGLFTKAQRQCVIKTSKADKTRATRTAIKKCKKDFRKKSKGFKKGYKKCITSIPQLKGCFA